MIFSTFHFAKYISSHPTNICSKPVLLPGALLFAFSISLNKFSFSNIFGTDALQLKRLSFIGIIVTFLSLLYQFLTKITHGFNKIGYVSCFTEACPPSYPKNYFPFPLQEIPCLFHQLYFFLNLT